MIGFQSILVSHNMLVGEVFIMISAEECKKNPIKSD